MKFLFIPLLGGLLASIGCKGLNSTHNSEVPEYNRPALPEQQTDSEKKAVPPKLTELVPTDQLNESNAQAQAQALYQTLDFEKNQIMSASAAK